MGVELEFVSPRLFDLIERFSFYIYKFTGGCRKENMMKNNEDPALLPAEDYIEQKNIDFNLSVSMFHHLRVFALH